jgi:hypothetical protein
VFLRAHPVKFKIAAMSANSRRPPVPGHLIEW